MTIFLKVLLWILHHIYFYRSKFRYNLWILIVSSSGNGFFIFSLKKIVFMIKQVLTKVSRFSQSVQILALILRLIFYYSMINRLRTYMLMYSICKSNVFLIDSWLLSIFVLTHKMYMSSSIRLIRRRQTIQWIDNGLLSVLWIFYMYPRVTLGIDTSLSDE